MPKQNMGCENCDMYHMPYIFLIYVFKTKIYYDHVRFQFEIR